jgi:chemotaxis protein MotA
MERRAGMDLATIIGLGGGFALIAGAIASSGSLTAFVNVPSIMIVLGGTFLVTTICFSIGEILRAQGVILKTIVHRLPDPGAAATQMIRLAERTRKDGPLVLQGMMHEFADIPFLHKALMLVVDGLPGDEVERVLRRDLNSILARHNKSSGVLRKAAEVSPAMGLIGTLVGLVQMLSNLNDPATIGPAMAVALLTTFYGAVLANMVFSPLAAKLERNSEEEALLNSLYLTAASSIGRQENPRRLEMLLNTMLPPAKRVRYYE